MEHEFAQQVTDTVNSVLEGVHTAIPGKIVSYDPATGLATVKPIMKYTTPDGDSISYPDISGVPVVYQRFRNQESVMAFPISAGDGCLLVIAEQSLDYWLYGRETSTDLKFDLTNAICIPGMFTTGNEVAKESCKDNAIIIQHGPDVRIKMTLDKITLKINDDLYMDIGKGDGFKMTQDVLFTGSHVHIRGNLIVDGAIIN